MFRTFEDAENDPGRWYEYGLGDDDKPVKFLVRALPVLKAIEIETRAWGKKGMSGRMGLDTMKAIGVLCDKAAAVLVDSENVVLLLGDAGAADAYAEVTIAAPSSEANDVTPPRKPVAGDQITLDRRWTPTLKARFLRDMPEVRAFILAKADELRRELRSEEGKD